MSKQTEINLLKEQLKELHEELTVVDKEWRKIDKKRMSLITKCQKIEEKIDMIKYKNISTKRVNWEELLDSSKMTDVKFKTLRDLLDNFTPGKFGITTNGYWPEIDQRAIQIILHKKDDELTEQILKALTKLIKYIKPIDGKKRINILKNSEWYDGNYQLTIDEEKKFQIVNINRKKETVLFEHKTLKKALKEIQLNYNCDWDEDEDD